MYKRIFFLKIVDENELGSDQCNYTFMRIDINLRLKIYGIDVSLNHIIATKLKTPNKEERATHIFFDSKNLSETEGCTGKARE